LLKIKRKESDKSKSKKGLLVGCFGLNGVFYLKVVSGDIKEL